MSIYKKLQKARVELQKVEMTKSGHNKFSNYNYFELADFMPHINRIMLDVGLCGVISFADNQAELVIFDVETDQKIIFYTPTADATVKGANPIQCLGSLHTYMRRYLWMLAFEIVEHDGIDALPQQKPEPKAETKPTPLNQQMADFEAALTGASDMQQLVAIWQSMPKELHAPLTKVKDAMKTKLDKKAA
jgi:hypothetical protein